jgi:hypothetical protein
MAYRLKILFYDFCYTAYLPVLKAHFDAAGMERSAGKQILYNAAGEFAAALVFLQDDVYFQPGVYICSVLSVHVF